MTNILRHVISYFFIAFSLIGCATKLQTEAAIGNAQSVMELLEKGESITETDFRGLTALHYAAKGGQEGIVDLLLTKGAEINARGNRGETPLYVATYYCHRWVVRTLLEKGANVANKFKTNNGLWLAPIFSASGNGCDPIILKYLLNAGADPNETEPGYGYRPLMFSANIKDPQTSELLLSAGAKVNHQANDGTTALIVAAWNGNKEVVQLLLASGADPTIRISQTGGPLNKGLEPTDTALSVAKRRGHTEVVALLEAAEKKTN
ncbi:MAG: ankyrin repeat domain-containing protein [Nitrospirales bacterium]|nr:ankyrin repeat domain-containing protein [Nitrospirales bacterium]